MQLRGTYVHSCWSCFFDGLQFSSVEFYELVRANLKRRDIPKIQMSDLELSEGGLFSKRRKYLRVARYQFAFDICAAPFGNGFFVSWWHIEDTTGCLTVYRLIPIIGNVLVKLFTRRMTYYGMDLENMFKECVHLCVLEAIDQITAEKGSRTLTAEERKYINAQQ